VDVAGTVDSEAARHYLRRVAGVDPAQFARWARRRGLTPVGTVRRGRSTTILWPARRVMELAEQLDQARIDREANDLAP